MSWRSLSTAMTSCPAFARLIARRLPYLPNPMTANFCMLRLSLELCEFH